MINQKVTLNEMIADVSRIVGDDWSTPKARIQLAAIIYDYKRQLEKLNYELTMKEAVMDKLSALITAWFQARLKDESNTS